MPMAKLSAVLLKASSISIAPQSSIALPLSACAVPPLTHFGA